MSKLFFILKFYFSKCFYIAKIFRLTTWTLRGRGDHSFNVICPQSCQVASSVCFLFKLPIWILVFLHFFLTLCFLFHLFGKIFKHLFKILLLWKLFYFSWLNFFFFLKSYKIIYLFFWSFPHLFMVTLSFPYSIEGRGVLSTRNNCFEWIPFFLRIYNYFLQQARN